MTRSIIVAAAAALLVLFVCELPASAQAGRRGPRGGRPRAETNFTDVAIDKAIEKGTVWLWTKQQGDGSWGAYAGDAKYTVGPTALATYSLLQTNGKLAQDARIVKAFDWFEKLPAVKVDKHPDYKLGTIWTYELGLMANAYQAANRTTKQKYAKQLQDIADHLIRSTANGSYNYDATYQTEPTGKFTGESAGDNSNSQYGALGVWAWVLDGKAEVPKEYWEKVMAHWLSCQSPDGGWTYREPGDSTGTMTAAGIASMFLCADGLLAEAYIKCNAGEKLRPVYKGLEWFDKNFINSLDNSGQWSGYFLYGVERVGLASGYKYFGAADWYKLGAEKILASQNPNGSWGGGTEGDVVETAYRMLFLVRGRNPVLFNKLEYNGDWNNRPRDLANACRSLLYEFDEFSLNWQIINLKVNVSEWHDAPILVINGSTEPKFTDDDLAKLRTFVMQGGMILSCAESSELNSKSTADSAFSKGIKEVYKKLWPNYEMQPVPQDHPLLSAELGKPLKDRPHLNMITNGVRILAIHADDDLPLRWQLNHIKQEPWAFDFLRHIAIWVTDMDPENNFRARGTTLWPEAKEFTPKTTISIARLAVGGNYDPEPLAWARFSRFMGNLYQIKVDVLDPMPIAKLADSGAKIAVLTGTNKVGFTAEEKATIKDFVEKGGTIIVDVAGGVSSSKGCAAFGESIDSSMSGIFGEGSWSQLTLDSPPFTMTGMKIEKTFVRRATFLKSKNTLKMNGISVGNRVAVLYSPLDLTAGMVGYQCYNMDGYAPGRGSETDPGTAFLVMRNLVVYAAGAQGFATSGPSTGPSSGPSSGPSTQPAPATPPSIN